MNRRNYALSAQLHAALRRHTVSILPIECDEKNLPAPVPGHQGSGTCIIIEGRYFIATAAHVVPNLPASDYWVLGEALRGGFFKRLGAGKRGGKPGDDLDIAWIEIHSNEAAALRSTFLTLERISPYSAEERDDLVVMGSPVANQKVSEHAGRPYITTNVNIWPTRSMKTGEICDMDKKQRLYVEWQSFLETENGDKERRPEPRGISGGSIWCTNIEAYGETWRADQVQLVGIEFAMQRSSGYQYLIGQQMHVWCEMVADDIPELASTIKTFLAGARFYPAR